MVRETVPTERTKSKVSVPRDIAAEEHSSAPIETVRRRPQFVMALTIAGTDQMKRTANYHAQVLSSSADQMEDVYWIRGNVTVNLIVKTVATKIRQCAIIENVIQNQNFRVRTVGVYQNCGFVILTTTVVTTQMNRLTCVDNETVRPDGRDVQERPITGAYRSGCSVTARMIAVMVRTNFRRTVRSAKLPRTFSVRTTGVYQRDGCVISKTIAVTIQTSRKTCAKDYIGSARNLSSSVLTENVYRVNGGVTMTMIAETIRTNSTAVVSSAKMAHSSVRVVIASRLTSGAMATGTVGTSAMR